MPKYRNYVHKTTKKDDKYDGMFNKKQLADLDGGIDDLTIEVLPKGELERRKKEQAKNGTGMNMYAPMNWDIGKV